jgi:hypothetical protein
MGFIASAFRTCSTKLAQAHFLRHTGSGTLAQAHWLRHTGSGTSRATLVAQIGSEQDFRWLLDMIQGLISACFRVLILLGYCHHHVQCRSLPPPLFRLLLHSRPAQPPLHSGHCSNQTATGRYTRVPKENNENK